MNPTDKSPLDNLDHPCRETCSGWQQGYDRGYLAVKQELGAARAENYQERCKTQTKINLIEQMQFEEKNLLKQLTDAQAEIKRLQSRRNHEFCEAQIKDYEEALEEIAKEFGTDHCDGNTMTAKETLNKWRAK